MAETSETWNDTKGRLLSQLSDGSKPLQNMPPSRSSRNSKSSSVSGGMNGVVMETVEETFEYHDITEVHQVSLIIH